MADPLSPLPAVNTQTRRTVEITDGQPNLDQTEANFVTIRAAINGLVGEVNGNRGISEIRVDAPLTLNFNDHSDHLIATTADVTAPDTLTDGFQCLVRNRGSTAISISTTGLTPVGSASIAVENVVWLLKNGTDLLIVHLNTDGGSQPGPPGPSTSRFPPSSFSRESADYAATTDDVGGVFMMVAGSNAFTLPPVATLTSGDFIIVGNSRNTGNIIVSTEGTASERVVGIFAGADDVLLTGEVVTYLWISDDNFSGWQRFTDATASVLPTWGVANGGILSGNTLAITATAWNTTFSNHVVVGHGTLQLPGLNSGIPVGSAIRIVATGESTTILTVEAAAGDEVGSTPTLGVVPGNELVLFKGDASSTEWEIFYIGTARLTGGVITQEPISAQALTSWATLRGPDITRPQVQTELDALGYIRAASETEGTAWEQNLGNWVVTNTEHEGAELTGLRIGFFDDPDNIPAARYDPAQSFDPLTLTTTLPHTFSSREQGWAVVAVPIQFTLDDVRIVVRDDSGSEVVQKRSQGEGLLPGEFTQFEGNVGTAFRVIMINSSLVVNSLDRMDAHSRVTTQRVTASENVRVPHAALPPIRPEDVTDAFRVELHNRSASLPHEEQNYLDQLTVVKTPPTNPTVLTASDGLRVFQRPLASAPDDVPATQLSRYPLTGGFFANPSDERVYVLVPAGTVVTGVDLPSGTAPTVTLIGERHFTDDSGNGVTLNAYRFDLSGLSFSQYGPGDVRGGAEVISEDNFSRQVQIYRRNLSQAIIAELDNHGGNTPTPTIPAILTLLASHLTEELVTSPLQWSAITNPYTFVATRRYAALWDENRRTVQGNYFDDLLGVTVGGYQTNNVWYYPPGTPNDLQHRRVLDTRSLIVNSPVVISNASGLHIPASEDQWLFVMTQLFANAPSATPDPGIPVLQFGDTAEPILRWTDEGLVWMIGRQDGGQQSRTYDEHLPVTDGQWGTRVGFITAGEAEIVLTGDEVFPLTVSIHVQGWDNDNDEGTITRTYVITSRTVSQLTATQLTFGSYNIIPDVVADVTYEHDNMDLPNARDVIFVRPTAPFANAAVHYAVTATWSRTDTWVAPSTYAEQPENAGSGHDANGLFDPDLYHRLDKMLVELSPWIHGDTSADPEMAGQIVVDGEHSGERTRLHRAKSDMGMVHAEMAVQGCRHGNFAGTVTEIIALTYSGPRPNGREMLAMFNAIGTADNPRWLGLFRHARDQVATWTLDGNMLLTVPDGQGGVVNIDLSTLRDAWLTRRTQIMLGTAVSSPPETIDYEDDPDTGSPYNSSDFDEIRIEFEDGVGVHGSIRVGSDTSGTIQLTPTATCTIQPNGVTFNHSGTVVTVVGFSHIT